MAEKMKDILKSEKDIQEKLRDPKLLKLIVDEVKKEGVVGEEDTIMALILKISLRLVKNATPTSSNLLVSDISGGGKDYVVERVCDVMLDAEQTYFHRTNLSPKVLNYWELKTKDGNVISWDGKILWLEDAEEDLIKSQGFKVRASGGNAITVLKDQVPTTVIIEGKPVFIVTSMKTSIDVEGTRRWDVVRIDTGEELTKAILTHSFRRAAGLIAYNPDKKLRQGLRFLVPYDVVIPYASKLENQLIAKMAMRTQVLKLLDYIKGSAVLHQYGRKKNKDQKLIATYEDYEYARFLFTHLQNMRGEALNRQEERFLNYLEAQEEPVKVRTIIAEMTGVTRHWIDTHKDDLVERELVTIVFKFDADSNREIQHLEANQENLSFSSKELPSAKQLFNTDGYAASGQIYRDINKGRKKLKLLFKNLR